MLNISTLYYRSQHLRPPTVTHNTLSFPFRLCCAYLNSDSSPWVSCISTCLVSRHTDCLCSRLLFQVYFYSEQPWKIECLSLEHRVGRLTYIISDSGPLSLEFHFSNATHCMFRYFLALFVFLCKNWDLENWCKCQYYCCE